MTSRISTFLCALLIAAAAACASAETAPLSDFEYRLDEAGGAVILKYSGKEATASVPDTLGGYPVTGIGAFAFYNRLDITGVVLPENLVSIESLAFYGCGLTGILIPAGVSSIGSRAFSLCKSLGEFTVSPDNPVYKTADGVLFAIDNLMLHTYPGGKSGGEYTVPEGTAAIGGYAFEGCGALQSITIPEGAASIGSMAFLGCSALSGVTIPASTNAIGYGVFEGTNLSMFTVTGGNTVYEQRDGILFDKAANMLHSYPCATAAKEYVVPEGTLAIAQKAFSGCQKLKTITIPDSVALIGSGAFQGCALLSRITLPAGLTTIEDFLFTGCAKLREITLPAGLLSIGYCAFTGCISIKAVIAPAGLTAIGGSAFNGCAALESVILPESVKDIGDNAFLYCKKLTFTAPSGSYAEQYAKDNRISAKPPV